MALLALKIHLFFLITSLLYTVLSVFVGVDSRSLNSYSDFLFFLLVRVQAPMKDICSIYRTQVEQVVLTVDAQLKAERNMCVCTSDHICLLYC